MTHDVNAPAEATAVAVAQALRHAEAGINALMQTAASASLTALRIALPEFVVQAARQLNADDDLRDTINGFFWDVAGEIEGDDDDPPTEDSTQTENDAPPLDPEPVVAIPDALALKHALVAFACSADHVTLKLSIPLVLADAARRFAPYGDRLTALEESIWDNVQALACAQLGIPLDEW